MKLNESERNQIQSEIRRIESATSAEIVVSVVPRSDSYPEIPWKAFAFGAAVGALDTALSFHFGFQPFFSRPLGAAFGILAPAIVSALGTVLLSPFARLFLNPKRAEDEAFQYAQSAFLNRGIQQTRRRTGILISLSLFERRVNLLADDAIRAKISPSDWQQIIGVMQESLGNGRLAAAIETGLKQIETMLRERGFTGSLVNANELPDAIIEQGEMPS